MRNQTETSNQNGCREGTHQIVGRKLQPRNKQRTSLNNKYAYGRDNMRIFSDLELMGGEGNLHRAEFT